MRRAGVCLAAVVAAALSVGCGVQFGGLSSSAPSGGMAVVDLDRVSAETGKNLEMKDAFNKAENALKAALVNAQASAESQLKAKAEEMGLSDESSDEVKQQFVRLRASAANQLSQAQRLATAKLTQFRQEQVALFRADLKPVLQEVAAKRGMSTVVPKNDGLLLAIDSGVDITDEVIAAYQKRPKSAAPAAPAAAATEKAAAQKAAAAKTAKQESETPSNTR